MTEFMLRVEESLRDGAPAAAGPEVTTSRRRSVGHGAHGMVELRSLAEQLISEANAVISPGGQPITLEDEAGDGQLAFALRCGQAWANVVTSFSDSGSWGQLVTPDSAGERYELTGTDALADLIIALILAGVTTPADPPVIPVRH